MTLSESTKSEKMSKPKSLLYLLSSIGNGASRATMAKEMKVSKMAISKKIASLREKGFVETLQTKPYAIEKLTPLGERVNQILVQAEFQFTQPKKSWRLHNLVVAWEIQDFGSWTFDEKRIKWMNNWYFQELIIKDHKIHVHSTGILKIYCPERYADNATTGFDQMVEQAREVARFIASRYKMDLINYKRIRSGHKEHQKLDNLARQVLHWKSGGVWTDNSKKLGLKLEADQDNYDLEKLLALPDLFEQKFIPAIQALTEQINLHLDAIKQLRDGAIEIRDAIKELKK